MADTSAEGQMTAHAGTYGSFLSIFKWGAVACAIIAAIVVLLIS